MSTEFLARTPDGSSIDASQVFSDDGQTGEVRGVIGQDVFRVIVPLRRTDMLVFRAGVDVYSQAYSEVTGELRLDGLKVLGPRGPAIPDPDGSLEDANRAISAILAQMRADGKIAS